MKKSFFTKAITLCTFFALIGAFLFYRSGRMNELFQGSPNGGATDNALKNRRDSLQKIRLSSSKSGLIITPNNKKSTRLDSLKNAANEKPQRLLMPTSKSMVAPITQSRRPDSSLKPTAVPAKKQTYPAQGGATPLKKPLKDSAKVKPK